MLKFRNHRVDIVGMKTKNNSKQYGSIIKRFRAVKDGVRIEKIYTPEVVRMSMDKLYIDIVEEFKKKQKR